ncbi:hypothetical protein GGR50DRAFT_356164 [Xylaria sp. CBS 124048]|nr:hypothetical protein GGR50DRAFT_356164 [Xylaria sp. CBS 124048]
MNEFVEARSLASLNQLAANPPQYPTKPNGTKQGPLTLYISRVPGTRDVILSTLKPQIKNVTAEDVASSLYYVHFQTQKDESSAPPIPPQHASSPRSSGETTRLQIPRKPLPATPSPLGQATTGATTAPAAPQGKENQGYEIPTRKPAPGIVPGEPSNHRHSTPPTTSRRVPLSPRSPPPGRTRQRAPSVSNTSSSQFYELPHIDEQPPTLPPRPANRNMQGISGDVMAMFSDAMPNAHALPSSPSAAPSAAPSAKRRPLKPFSLALIRRDPSSGQQWNVGRIESFQLDNADYSEDEKRPQVYPSIKVYIETSGYAKFRGMPLTSEISLPGGLDMRPGSSSSATRLPSADFFPSMPASGMFERQVKMTYSPSFAASLRQHFRARSSVDEGRGTSPVRHFGHNRESSQISMGSPGGDHDGTDVSAMTQPAAGLKPRGYAFYSPWNGRCEFTTGNMGRTLKCRHVLPSYSGGVFNPLVGGSENDHGDERTDNARPISELRFNIPSNELLADRRSVDGGMRTRDQLQSQFNRMMAKAQGLDLEDSDDGDFQFDLGVGREKAGGGNRGKRAKMGKLIIFDEGLKMLDLAVAANVGIWWNSWERTCH